MTNTQTMVRCFFHNPPNFKILNVSLSWIQQPAEAIPGTKRQFPTNVPKPVINNKHKPREYRQLYTPPVGQWSRKNTGNFRRNKPNRSRYALY